MIFSLYIWTAFAAGMVHATWYKSQDMESFLRELQNQEKMEILKTHCEGEREKTVFPERCLHLMSAELGNPDSPFSKPSFFNGISDLCRKESLLEPVSIEKVQTLLELPHIPPVCREALETRLGDIRYLSETQIGPDFE